MTSSLDKLRYLLLQVRNQEDPMRPQEVGCFARALDCERERIEVFDLLTGVPTIAELNRVDVVFLGGSGDYSVAEGGPWLPAALEAMRELYDLEKPTFASCWGFQALSKALGGDVVTDLSRAEVGTIEVQLTEVGQADPVFGGLPAMFPAQMGHQDIVVQLPETATLLASTDVVANEAFRLEGKPIYCTQFHPELNRDALLERIYAYPWYIEKILGVSIEKFAAEHCFETPETDQLLTRFVRHVFG